MRIGSAHLAAAGAILAASLPNATARAAEPHTAAAVRAADDAWGAAEVRGDAAFVDRLLLPDYRSVGPTGSVTTKVAIVDHARARGPSSDMVAQVAAWKAAHPTRADVVIVGDTAVLTWGVDPARRRRADLFVRRVCLSRRSLAGALLAA